MDEWKKRVREEVEGWNVGDRIAATVAAGVILLVMFGIGGLLGLLIDAFGVAWVVVIVGLIVLWVRWVAHGHGKTGSGSWSDDW